MNTIHCIVWSESKQAWVVAHEAAKTKGKPGSSRSGTAASALVAILLTAGMALAAPPIAVPATNTLPTVGQVVAGQATIGQSGNRMDVNQTSNRAILNWNSFSIGSGSQVNFNQPSNNSVALNRVLGSDPSAIYGSLTANGQVFLVNPNGVLFGRGARVDVGGLVASSMGISNADFLNGVNRFTRDSGTASLVNEGDIYAKYVALLAPEVRNSGLISATRGSVAMAAGDAVTLNISGQNLVDVQVDAATIATLVENRRLIQADDGTVILSAQAASGLVSRVVNSGAIEANGITQNGGTIYLSAGQEVAQSGSLSANAGAQGEGGHITVLASLANPSSLTLADGRISAQGGPLGGNGGQVETSGSHLQIADTLRVNTSAANGQSGNWLLDPNDFTIAASGGNMTGSTIATNLLTTDVTIATATQGTSGGNGDIFVNDNIAVAGSSAGHSLTLQAQRNIVVQAGNAFTDAAANPISLNLQSGGATVFLDNVSASSAVTAVNIHGNLNIGGLNCAPGSTCYSNGNSVYAMGAYVGRYVSLNTNGADINISGKAFSGSGSGSLGGLTANLPLGFIAGTFSSLNGRNISLYGESASNIGIQANYGDPCNSPTTCTVDSKITASNQISVVGKATGGNNSGLSVNGSTWTAPTISLTGIGSGTSAGLSLNGVGYGSPTFNASTALNWISNKLAISNTTLSGSGALSIKPYSTSFSTPFVWPSGALNLSALNGLTIGKAGNTASITMSGVQSVNGDINLIADGAGGNVTLASGTQFTAASGGNINVAAGGNFVNSSGSSALATSGGGRWLVYSNAPATDTFGGLSSGNLAIWNKTYAGYLPGSVTETGNRYLFASQPGLTVTATNATKTYGQVVDLSTPIAGSNYTVSGLVNAATYGGVFSQDSYSGTPALTSSGALANSSVAGTPYSISSSAGSFTAPAGYSAVIYVNGSLTVTPAALTVTASNATKTYGQAPTLSAFSSSGLQNGETIGSVTEVSAGTAATAGVAGSPYVITPSAATGGTFDASNYNITYANGSLTVAPASLTVTASNAAKTYDGRPYSGGNGVSFSGFVNNETASILNGALGYRGASQGATNAGNYLIIPSGLTATNYIITPIAGSLVINQATLIATADDKSRYAGDVNPALTISYSGFKNGDNISIYDRAPLASTVASTNSVAGKYLITLNGGYFNNYALTLNSGTITVNDVGSGANPDLITKNIHNIYPDLNKPNYHMADQNYYDNNIYQNRFIGSNSVSITNYEFSMQPVAAKKTSNDMPFIPAGHSLAELKGLNYSAHDLQLAGYSWQELKDSGFSFVEIALGGAHPSDMRTIGCPASYLKSMSYTASSLQKSGYSWQDLKEAGFSIANLVSAGAAPVDLRAIGVSFAEIAAIGKPRYDQHWFGYSVADFANAGYTVSDLRNIGYTADDFILLRASASDLKKSGYSLLDIKNAGYPLWALKSAGYSTSDLRSAGYSLNSLKDVGFSATDVLAAGFTASNLKTAGYTASDLKTANLSISDLKNAGFGFSDIKDLGYSASDLRRVGYSKWDIFGAFPLRDLKKAGYSINDITMMKYNYGDFSTAGYSVSELRAAGATMWVLKNEIGATATDMKSAGYTASDLYNAGYNAWGLKSAGYPALELKNAGYSAYELKNAGYSAGDMRIAGYSASDLRVVGFTKSTLRAQGFSDAELSKAGY